MIFQVREMPEFLLQFRVPMFIHELGSAFREIFQSGILGPVVFAVVIGLILLGTPTSNIPSLHF